MEEDMKFFWQKPGWLEQASAWIDVQLTRLGFEPAGLALQPHMRPWSTALAVPTSHGDLYFKATAPILSHEIPITQALAGWNPDCILPVLAAAPERGWMLLPDGGRRLREGLRASGDMRPWEVILAGYAGLQIDLARRVPEILRLGAPDRRLEELPALYAGLLADEGGLLIDQPDGLSVQQAALLQSMSSRLSEMCQELAAFGIPASLNHGDLHDGNIFFHDEGCWFFDWGDCSITHPFFSLRTVFVSLENSLGLAENAAELARLRSAYLEAWTGYAPPHELERAYALSRRLAPICSALSWDRVVSSLPAPLRGDAIYAVPSLLSEFLEYYPGS